MGTCGAYGGSDSSAWKRVREEWGGLGPASGGDGASGSSGGAADQAIESGTGAENGGVAYDALTSAIASALLGEDTDARRRRVPTVALGSVLARRGGGRSSGGSGGGGGGVGPRGGGSVGGRRITSQAGRGGAAIGAAAAYRDRDANALAEYGLTLDELDSLTPRMRCARILDVAIGQAGHPDEQAMREASLAQIKALVSGKAEASALSPVEAVRDFIGELSIRLGLIELRDQILTSATSVAQSRQREKGLRQWVKAKIAGLDLARYGQVSTGQLHQLARQMSADVLRLLRGRA
jgi:hypothetical protein